MRNTIFRLIILIYLLTYSILTLAKTDPISLDVTALWEFGYWGLGVSVAYLLFKDL